MLLRHNRNIDIRWQPALAGIRVMLQIGWSKAQPLLTPALAGIRVMLHQIFNVLSIGIRPALAGIRVMLLFAIISFSTSSSLH